VVDPDHPADHQELPGKVDRGPVPGADVVGPDRGGGARALISSQDLDARRTVLGRVHDRAEARYRAAGAWRTRGRIADAPRCNRKRLRCLRPRPGLRHVIAVATSLTLEQCLYYGGKRSFRRVFTYFCLQLVVFAGVQVALVFALRVRPVRF
jgi:hypothetical protein